MFTSCTLTLPPIHSYTLCSLTFCFKKKPCIQKETVFFLLVVVSGLSFSHRTCWFVLLSEDVQEWNAFVVEYLFFWTWLSLRHHVVKAPLFLWFQTPMMQCCGLIQLLLRVMKETLGIKPPYASSTLRWAMFDVFSRH